jgi:hypothetical protein
MHRLTRSTPWSRFRRSRRIRKARRAVLNTPIAQQTVEILADVRDGLSCRSGRCRHLRHAHRRLDRGRGGVPRR